ncbi:MAG: hypothetical protein WD845_14630 [Pirellulales bacterium]
MNAHGFGDFAARFMGIYWQDVVDNIHRFPPYEPCEGTLDEILAETKYSTSRENAAGKIGKVFVLRMFATSGSTWRFVFTQMAGKWKILAAFANDETDEHRCDLLDETYGQYFRESLERTTALASNDPRS